MADPSENLVEKFAPQPASHETEDLSQRYERAFRAHSVDALDPARRVPSVAGATPDGSRAHAHDHHHHHEYDHHEPRISHRAEVLVEARLDDLAHHHLAPPALAKPVSKRRAMLVNSWVLLLAAGLLVITIISAKRLHVAEPLDHAHGVSGAEPYVMALSPDSLRYLYVIFIGAPWVAPGGAAGAHSRRRLLASALAGAGARDEPGLPGRPLPPLTPATAAAHLRALPTRRVLSASPHTAGVSGSPGGAPKVVISLMQRNASFDSPAVLPADGLASAVLSPEQIGLVAVAPSRTCQLKGGAASRCLLSFQSGDLDPAVYRPGEELLLVFSIGVPGQVAFDVHANELGALGVAKNWVSLAILVLMLVGIASEKVHRMYCAFLGAFGQMALLLWMDMVPSLETVTSWLDESTLGLLFGMMILVGQLKNTGLFEVLCAATLKACGGRMWLLSVMMLYLTGFVSAFLDNVTTMLLMGPVTLSMMQTCNRDPRPLLLAQVLFSNIGGTATMVGDPPNIIIGTALSKYIGFIDFILNLAPGVLLASAPCLLLILWLFRTTLLGAIPSYDDCLKTTAQYRITDWNLMAKAGYVTTAVVVGFLLHPLHHLDPAWFAILGATLICIVVAPMEVDEVMHSVEWDMLLFFAAQFVMVEAASEIGMIDMIAGWLEKAISAAPPGSRTIVAIEILLWASAVISGMLDNIPYTITMVPVIEHLANAGLGLELTTLAWALAFGACFGGNATLIGASANIVTATMLDKSGYRMSFFQWLKYGVPVTVLSVAVANLYMLRYAF